jgi:hypothetical protein
MGCAACSAYRKTLHIPLRMSAAAMWRKLPRQLAEKLGCAASCGGYVGMRVLSELRASDNAITAPLQRRRGRRPARR